MPKTIRTQDGIVLEIPDSQDVNDPALKAKVKAIREQRAALSPTPTPTPAPAPAPAAPAPAPAQRFSGSYGEGVNFDPRTGLPSTAGQNLEQAALAVAKMGLRSGGPAVGQSIGMATGPVSPIAVPLLGAVGGFTGELGAQALEGKGYNMTDAYLAAVQGGIPFSPFASKAVQAGTANAREIAKYAVKEGSKFAAANIGIEQARNLAEDKGVLTPKQLGLAALAGYMVPGVSFLIPGAVEPKAQARFDNAKQISTAQSRIRRSAEKLVNLGGAVEPELINQSEGGWVTALSTQQQRLPVIQQKNNALARSKIRESIGLTGDGPLTGEVLNKVTEKNFAPYRQLEAMGPEASSALERLQSSQGELKDLHGAIRSGQKIRADIQPRLDALENQIGQDFDILNYHAAAKNSPTAKVQLENFHQADGQARALASRFDSYEQNLFERSKVPNYRKRTLPELSSMSPEQLAELPTVEKNMAKEYLQNTRQATSSLRRLKQTVTDRPQIIADFENARKTIAKTNMLLNEGVVEMGGSGYVNADKLADLSNRPDSRGRLTDSLAELADLAKTLPNHFDNPAKRIPASTPKPGMIEAMALSQGPQGVPVATAGLIRKQTGPRIAPQVTYPEYQKKLIESMNYRINPPEQNANLIQNLLRYGALQPNR